MLISRWLVSWWTRSANEFWNTRGRQKIMNVCESRCRETFTTPTRTRLAICRIRDKFEQWISLYNAPKCRWPIHLTMPEKAMQFTQALTQSPQKSKNLGHLGYWLLDADRCVLWGKVYDWKCTCHVNNWFVREWLVLAFAILRNRLDPFRLGSLTLFLSGVHDLMTSASLLNHNINQ